MNSKKETLTTYKTPGDPVCEEEEEETGKTQKMNSSKTTPTSSSPIKANTNSTSSLSNPKLTKKQQKLAESAKDMRCISQYFGKKQVDATQVKGGSVISEPEEESSRHHSPSPNLNDFQTMNSTSMDVESISENDAIVYVSPSAEETPSRDETAMELTELQRYDGRRHSLRAV